MNKDRRRTLHSSPPPPFAFSFGMDSQKGSHGEKKGWDLSTPNLREVAVRRG